MPPLDFSHKVDEVPAGQPLPKAQPSTERVAITQFADVQSALTNYADASNWLSSIGSEVATRASNAIAYKIGGELGKNPQGDIGIPLTDFDKVMQESYRTQAQATLGLQANKLITEANIETAKADRITPDLIARTNNKVSIGLKNIFKNAPAELVPHLEAQYGVVQLNQATQLSERMFREQRQDRQNNTALASQMNAENAYSFGLNGNEKAGEAAIESTRKLVEADVASRLLTPVQAKEKVDTVRQSFYSGKLLREYKHAQSLGQGEEYLQALAEKKPSQLTDNDYNAVVRNLVQSINQEKILRSQAEALRTQNMYNRVMSDPTTITGSEWDEYEANVSRIQASKMKFAFNQQLKKRQNEDNVSNILSANWDNPTVMSNATAEQKNSTFNKKVNYAMEQSRKTTIPLRSPVPLSRDEAEIMVVTNAAAEIPVFTKTIQNKLKSSNPLNVESALFQIHALLQNGNGQALSGLTEQDWSMYSAAQSLRDSPDPIKANQDAHNRIYNQDQDIEKLNNQKWAKILSKNNRSSISNDTFALQTFGFNRDDFVNRTIASAYGMNILNKFHNFFAISGDYEEAKESTQRWVDQNYGDTYINGGKYKTLHPIERQLGFTGRDGTPYIQQNIIEQFNEKLIPLKEAYDKGITNEYWETIPVKIPEKKTLGTFQGKTLLEAFNKQYVQEEELRARFNKPEGNLLKDIRDLDLSVKPYTETESQTLGQAIATTRSKNRKFEEATPKPSQEHGIIFKTYDPIKLKRTMRTKNGIKEDIFNVILNGNPFGEYDVAIETKQGQLNLFREAPYLRIMSVRPNHQAILEHYNKDHS